MFLVLIVIMISCDIIYAFQNDRVGVGWNVSPFTNVAGYVVYYGTISNKPSNKIVAEGRFHNTVVIKNLQPHTTYYISVTCYSTDKKQSDFSKPIIYKTQ